MRVLVLGGYGLIGLAVARELLAAGHSVTGLGRSMGTGERLEPRMQWRIADLATLQSAESWRPFLGDIDVVVNAAGALQDGLRDDLERVHHGAIAALVAACGERMPIRLIQISAPGATPDASTHFMRSKARGDAAIRASRLGWVILRPGLVLGRDTYGGSALLRATAAFPRVMPIALGDSRIQTVALTDVAQVVREAVEGAIPACVALDLVEDEAHSLREIAIRIRTGLGLDAASVVSVPRWAAYAAAAIADLLGHLGWRSPLRTTPLRALEDGVRGDPEPLRRLRGAGLKPLDQILAEIPAGTAERWQARAYLLMPLIVATLAAFWLASGIIGALDVERAARVIPTPALAPGVAAWLVLAGAAVDIVLGAAILIRPFARIAALGMVLVSVAYLVAGTVLTPGLWLDPLGPLVKIVPAMVLAGVAATLLEER